MVGFNTLMARRFVDVFVSGPHLNPSIISHGAGHVEVNNEWVSAIVKDKFSDRNFLDASGAEQLCIAVPGQPVDPVAYRGRPEGLRVERILALMGFDGALKLRKTSISD